MVPEGLEQVPRELFQREAERRIVFIKGGQASSNGITQKFTSLPPFIQAIADAKRDDLLIDVDVQRHIVGQEAATLAEQLSGLKLAALRGLGDTAWRAVELVGISARSIKLHAASVVFRDCDFGDADITAVGDVTFVNCTIGRLKIAPRFADATHNLTFENCRIVRIEVTDLSGFRQIRIAKTWFATKLRKAKAEEEVLPDGLSLDRRSFAALHDFAVKTGDSKLAHFARGHELAIERAEADGQEKIFLRLWGLFGNYGLSLWRPFFWLIGAVAAFAILLFLTGTVPAEQLSGTGWRDVLFGRCFSAQVSRAVVGAVDGVFTPFGIFSGRKMVVPECLWVAVLQFFYSYFCLGLIFLFGFSVRRRFKL